MITPSIFNLLQICGLFFRLLLSWGTGLAPPFVNQILRLDSQARSLMLRIEVLALTLSIEEDKMMTCAVTRQKPDLLASLS